MGRLIIPAINAELTTIRDSLFEFATVDRATVGCKLATEVGIKVLTGLIEGGDVTIATAPLAVGLGVVGIEVVTARKRAMTARHPAYMRLLLGVTLHVTLKVLLTLEAALAAGLLALELHLLDDGWQVFETQVRTEELLFG
jgi:hypothetical protein